MATRANLLARFNELQREATLLAGGLNDLTQRATVYRQIFRDSGRQHIFPLIAAHGALWARGYFRFGLALAEKLVWQYFLSPATRRDKLRQLAEFADAFRDINRRVCVDTYTNFRFTAELGEESAAAELVPPHLLSALNDLHAARRAGRTLTSAEQQGLFTTHFIHEQKHVVGPSVAAAVDAFAWPLLKFIALRPLVRFAYFPAGSRLWFRDFTRREERVANGLRAFQMGAEIGWDAVELKLQEYDLLPLRTFTEPEANFAALRAGILG